MERFLPAEEAALVRTSFAGLWSLDGADGDAAIEGFTLRPEARARRGWEGSGTIVYAAAA